MRPQKLVWRHGRSAQRLRDTGTVPGTVPSMNPALAFVLGAVAFAAVPVVLFGLQWLERCLVERPEGDASEADPQGR